LCGEEAWLEEDSHETVLGYGPENGSPGCGARFVAIAEHHPHGGSFLEGLKTLRPDLPLLDLWLEARA